MINFYPLDLSDSRQSSFIYDLVSVCSEEMLDDYFNDPLKLIFEYHDRIQSGQTYAFIVTVDDKPAGAVWVDINRLDIGAVHGGLFPAFRKGFTAQKIFKMFIDWCFQNLNVRKLEGWMPTDNESAEQVLRWCGFSKEGISKEAVTKGGKPQHLVILGLTRNQYIGGLTNGQRRIGRRRSGKHSRKRRLKRS